MDSSANVDPLNDSAPMPELSFEDLLDDSPVKKSFRAVEDPLEFEDELPLPLSDTLNTPGPKKPPTSMKQSSGAIATTTMTQNPSTNPKTTTTAWDSAAKTVAATNASVKLTPTTTPTSSNPTTPVVLNHRNLLPKAATSGAGQLVKISPKIMVTAATSTLMKSPSTTTTVTATSATGGKTAIKTASGQILYIQKKAATSSANMTNASGGTTTLTIATTPTSSNSNKTVAFKLMRTAGGSLVPIQTTTGSPTSASTTTSATPPGATTKNTLTLSPKVASQLQAAVGGGKRIVTASGGQVVIKTSLAPTATVTTTRSTTTTATLSATSTSTTTTTYRVPSSGAAGATSNISVVSATNTNKTGLPAGHKIFVQSANGKQILVSNQQFIKLSPKPPTLGATINSSTTTTTSSSTTVSTNAARQLQTIQQSGKQVQYLRVLPKSNAEGSGTVVSSSAAAVLSSSAAGSSTTQSKTNATSTFKILNAGGMPSKFTVVRPSPTSGSTKLILTQSPKKEGAVPVTFSPITSKVQKTIVTVPKLSTLGDGQQRSLAVNTTTSSSQSSANLISSTSSQLANTSASQSLIKSNTNATNATSSSSATLIRKHKISEINSELKRITTTGVAEDDSVDMDAPPEAKKLASGSRIVMLPRSMLRTTSSGQVRQVTLQSNAGTVGDSNGGGAGTSQSPTRKLSMHQQQQMQSVLKSNNCYVVSADGSGQKSLLINGKAQTLLTQQQQQQKSLQLKRQMQQQQQQLQQQQQYKYLQQKKQEQLEHQNDTKVPTLQRIANINSSSNNNNTAGSYNNNNANSVDNKSLNFKIKVEPLEFEEDIKPIPSDLLADAANGGIRRKHCNCSKSQCLKLYCDCFANGEFCQDCTCKDCFNNLENEDQRQRAIKNCLERNPSAFKPKITTSREQGDMRHNKGCNCKRSGCLKNYCECYEAKIPCSSNCKCMGCRNIEERPDLDMDPTDSKLLATIPSVGLSAAGQKRTYDKTNSKTAVNDKFYKDTAKTLGIGNDLLAGLAVGGSASIMTGGGSSSCSGSGSNGVSATPGVAGTTSGKQQCNFITQDVVEATIQCLISQADQCEKNGLPAYQTEKMVMEEMGRCLVEIIDFSIRNTDTSFTQE